MHPAGTEPNDSLSCLVVKPRSYAISQMHAYDDKATDLQVLVQPEFKKALHVPGQHPQCFCCIFNISYTTQVCSSHACHLMLSWLLNWLCIFKRQSKSCSEYGLIGGYAQHHTALSSIGTMVPELTVSKPLESILEQHSEEGQEVASLQAVASSDVS